MTSTGRHGPALPTVREVLGLEAVRRGQPQVLAGADRLDAPVRWVHAIELADAPRLLRGGELVLTTGIALPAEPDSLAGYVAGLAGVGVSALAVELGRRYSLELPEAFSAAARQHGLPLIVFRREVAFVEITEAVHSRIIDDQIEQLRTAARLHEVFTDLAVSGAVASEVIRQAALLAGRPVILEDLGHHVVAFDPAQASPAAVLSGFAERSRACVPATRTGYDEKTGWLVTTAGARGEDWGRLILVCDRRPGAADTVLLERAATTLALGRLAARQQQSLQRQAHGALLATLLAQADADLDEVAVRARALGVPVTGRRLLGVVLRFRAAGAGLTAQARVFEAAEAMADACRAQRIPALIGSLDDTRAGVLLSMAEHAETGQAQPGEVVSGQVQVTEVLTRLCTTTRQRLSRTAPDAAGGPPGEPVIGAGSPAASLREARRSLLEAQQVADAAAQHPLSPGDRPFYALADLRLRGLLQLLARDGRLAAFADRELGPLLAYDANHGTDLVPALAAYLAAGGSKVAAAERVHLARPTMYERLRRIERVLGISLESAESRTSLHVALLAMQHPPAGST
ncbi:MAG TPA: PucR family transcriptional regulator [Streptosporangiaceae bacterium]|nr:PucR family transcriptional regulator [Streptosporangiaceae bacterium]